MSIDYLGYVKFVEFFLRKGVYFGIYFVLGGSLFLGVFFKLKIWWLIVIFVWFLVIGYVGLDEFY